jgi:carboxypeptidase Taq
MEEKLKQLKSILAEVSDLYRVIALLGWDQQTYMPPGGARDRGNQYATLSRLAHIKFTSREVGELLDALRPYAEQLDPDSDDACLIRVTAREFEKSSKVPPEFVAEEARVTTLAHQAWEQARAEDNFAMFQPHLEKVVDLRQRFASFFEPYDHVYDPLLDDFEPGMKTEDVKAIFAALRPKQVALIQAVVSQPQVDDSFLHQSFPEQQQREFGIEVITKFGFDWKRGRMDKAVHPFTSGFGIDDVRITTRYFPDYFSSALASSMHEAGHALYDQGIDPSLDRTLLAYGASLALHESQSRLWENLVGRSLPFWEYFYPRLQEVFPEQFRSVDLETFYKGFNKVEPSLIRVEADEATYNLHIMLRLELEIALVEGELKVSDLPEAWNARMEDYLGIRPPNNALGVLQDVHWSGGSIGYFSTYALGNLISAQLWKSIHSDIPDLDEQIRHGEFAALLGWLRDKVHRHGRKYEPQELVERITGSKIDPSPYVEYLRDKFGEIYGIQTIPQPGD